MPNIRTYNAGDMALHPTERGSDAYAQAGRRIGAIYADIGSAERAGTNAWGNALGEGIKVAGDAYVKFQDNQQISAGMPAAAGLLLDLTTKANNITKTADPNDPAVYGRFSQETLEPALEKFQSAFTTENSRNWAQAQANQIRTHMQRTISADMSTMASMAVKLNLEQTANIAGNTVAQDPSALPAVLDMLNHSVSHVVASSPNISAEDAARVNGEVMQKLNEHVVKAAIQGAILKNPDAGLAMSRDPAYAKYLDGAEVNMFAKEVIRANKADATNARLEAERQRRETSEQNRDQIVSDIYAGKDVKLNQILSIPQSQIRAEDREHLLNIAEKREVDVPEATAKRNAVDLITDIHAGKVATLDPIYKALGDGKIDYQRFTELKTEFEQSRSPSGQTLADTRGEFLKQYQPIVNPMSPATGQRTEEGYKRAYQLQKYAAIREGELRAAGKDPASLYDPRSPDFLGRTPYASPKSSAQLLQSQKSGGEVQPASKAPANYPDAKLAPDGKWYIQKDGKYFQVK